MNSTPRLPRSGAACSVKFCDDVTRERSAEGRLTLGRQNDKLLDVPAIPLLACLAESWLTEEAMDRQAECSANPLAVHFMYEQLFSLGLLQARFTIDGRDLFSLHPAPHWRSWRESLLAAAPSLSPHACLRRAGHGLVLEMPLSRRKCFLHDEDCLVWLMELIRGGGSPLPEGEARTAFYRALNLMEALEEGNPGHEVWEFHDLLFFHHSSIGFHEDPIGATWRLKDKLPPAPLFKPAKGKSVPLPEPDGELLDKLRSPFAEVLSSRRSGRLPGSRPMTLEELSALLYASARVQAIPADPADPSLRSLRPSPSGGALHSLEIYPLVGQCTGLASGAWRYHPERHRLESVAANQALLDAYLNSNPHDLIPGADRPHIQLALTSRFLRDAWKYEKIAYRLVLQDLGCLYQTLSLTATALGLASCILGTVDARRLGRILKLEPLAEPVIGGMTLSSRPGKEVPPPA